MNAVVGTIESKRETVLTGDHHIVESIKMQDNITNLNAGDVLVSEAEGYRKGTAEDTAYDAVALESCTKTEKTIIPACVHGSVRADKVLLAGDDAPESVRAKLRLRGIYATGEMPEDE